MLKKLVKILFVGALLLALLLSFAQAIFMPTDINQFEVRTAKKLPPFSVSGYMDSSFQEGAEAALADQVSFSTYLKRAYIELFAKTNSLFDPLVARIPNRYIDYWDLKLYNGQLVFHPEILGEYEDGVGRMTEMYNGFIQALPEQDFYLYYVDKDVDINFETGEKSQVYQYLTERIDIPAERCARFAVESFDEYRDKYYFSDHHWNYIGSYEGYIQLLSLLAPDESPLVPLETVQLQGEFFGSKAVSAGTTGFSDHPMAYRFDFPAVEIFAGDTPIGNYGAQEEIIAGYPMTPSYSSFYGDDLGQVRFSSGREDRDNLLIISESYDNAVLKLLSGHFNELHSVDFRYYLYQTGEEFDLVKYVEEHDIDKVLLMGASEFFSAIAIGEG